MILLYTIVLSALVKYRYPADQDYKPKSRSPEQRAGIGIASHESAVQFGRVLAVTLRKNLAPKRHAGGSAENAFLLEAREGIRIQHLRPFVAVVSSSVAHRAGEQMREACDHPVVGRKLGCGKLLHHPPRI